jgi:hypothetical protein
VLKVPVPRGARLVVDCASGQRRLKLAATGGAWHAVNGGPAFPYLLRRPWAPFRTCHSLANDELRDRHDKLRGPASEPKGASKCLAGVGAARYFGRVRWGGRVCRRTCPERSGALGLDNIIETG